VYVRDDDVDLLNMGLFFQAPSRYDEDYFAFLLLKHIIGNYVPERDDILNDPALQYSTMISRFGQYEDLATLEAHYIPLVDNGIAGYFF
jgi:hypothetical protein